MKKIVDFQWLCRSHVFYWRKLWIFCTLTVMDAGDSIKQAIVLFKKIVDFLYYAILRLIPLVFVEKIVDFLKKACSLGFNAFLKKIVVLWKSWIFWTGSFRCGRLSLGKFFCKFVSAHVLRCGNILDVSPIVLDAMAECAFSWVLWIHCMQLIQLILSWFRCLEEFRVGDWSPRWLAVGSAGLENWPGA